MCDSLHHRNGVFYYGLILAGMVYAAFNHSVQPLFLEAVGTVFTTGPLAAVGGAHLGGAFWKAVAVTFGVNLALGSFATITIPSLIIPFSGLLMGCYRALLWGIIYSPTGVVFNTENPGLSVFVVGLLLVEGQAYVPTMLAAFIHGKAFLFPRRVGEMSHWRGYLFGLRHTLRLYLLVAITLAIGASYYYRRWRRAVLCAGSATSRRLKAPLRGIPLRPRG